MDKFVDKFVNCIKNNKGISILLGFSLFFNICFIFNNDIVMQKNEKIQLEYKDDIKNKEYIISNLKEENKKLEEKIDDANVWFEMTEEEKENAKKEVEIRKEKEEQERKERQRKEKEKKEREEQEEISKRKGNINKSEYKEYKAYYDKDENGYDIIDSRHYPKEGDKVCIMGMITDVDIYNNMYGYTISGISMGNHCKSGLYAYIYVNEIEGCQSYFKTCQEEWNSKTFYGEIIGFKTINFSPMKWEYEVPIISVDYIEE